MQPDALFYDLYLRTLGGGERYLLAMAEVVAADRQVEVAAPSLPGADRLRHFGMPAHLPTRRVHPTCFIPWTRGAPLLVYLANGVPLPSLADRSIAVVQFPMRSLGTGRALRQLRNAILSPYELVTYSNYVRSWIERRWDRTAEVIHPPVRLGQFRPAAKEPMILAVGRFFAVQHNKRQDVLIEGFRQFSMGAGSDWTLTLVGGRYDSRGTRRFIEEMQVQAVGLRVRFVFDATEAELLDLFGRASLFWHAAGFGRAADAPEDAEHFGMSTVEAMGHGVVPLVYDDGGQREVLAEGGGLLWTTIDELVSKTSALAASDTQREALATTAVRAAQRFGRDRFDAQVEALIHHRS